MSLIESFKEQGWDTIRQTLEALAADSKVFSARIQSELSFMGGHEQYVYMQGDGLPAEGRAPFRHPRPG